MRRASASPSGPGGRTCDSSPASPAASDTLRSISSRSGRIRRLMSDNTPFSSTAPSLSLLSSRLAPFSIRMSISGSLTSTSHSLVAAVSPAGKRNRSAPRLTLRAAVLNCQAAASASRIAGSVIELGGGAYGLYQQYQSIQNRADGKQRAVTEAFDARIANQETASWALVQNQGDYVRDMVRANRWRAEGLTAAEVAGASWAVAGANRGAAVAKGGVNQGYHLDLQANRITYDGAVKAATQVRDASFEAARLRALSTVVSAVGHNVARDMEQGLALRY